MKFDEGMANIFHLNHKEVSLNSMIFNFLIQTPFQLFQIYLKILYSFNKYSETRVTCGTLLSVLRKKRYKLDGRKLSLSRVSPEGRSYIPDPAFRQVNN